MSDSPERSPKWELRPLQIPELAGPFEVSKDGLSIGRDDSNDVALPSGSYPGVSSHHVRVYFDGPELMIEDLGSKNGTIVSGQRVETSKLSNGAVVQLGSGGPRFLVMRETGLDETVAIATPTVERPKMGRDTVMFVKEKLGLGADERVDEKLQAQETRAVRRSKLLAFALVGSVVALVVAFQVFSGSALAKLQRELDKKLDAARSQFNDKYGALEKWRTRMDADRVAWNDNKSRLEKQQRDLIAGIQKLGKADAAAEGELKGLRDRLEKTSLLLSRYNPVNLEKAKLEEVSRVESAVVMVEASLTYVEETTKKVLHIKRDEEGDYKPNFRDEGEPLERSGSGSGFCFDKMGWILTNAHVVFKKRENALDFDPDIKLTPRLRLDVVWTGTEERLPAKLVSWVSNGREDLALLKVQPYDDMPYISQGIDIERDPPLRNSEVFVIGFPLGMKAMQEDEKVIASTFRGIVSRYVDNLIQVDAAVHPGASGGPLIDANGAIVGVVVGRQRVSRTQSASDIGYIIPIARAGQLWPPSAEALQRLGSVEAMQSGK